MNNTDMTSIITAPDPTSRNPRRKSGGRVWYTSDLHFYHRLVAADRGFDSPEDMNEHIVSTWASQVRDTDTVFVLGDVCISRTTDTLELVNALPGRKHLIAGNHDAVHPLHSTALSNMRKWLQVFETITPYVRRRLQGRELILCHFPYREWGDGPERVGSRYNQYRLPDLGIPLMHGHTHGPEREHDRSLHVGWDAWGRLVSQEEVLEWLSTLA